MPNGSIQTNSAFNIFLSDDGVKICLPWKEDVPVPSGWEAVEDKDLDRPSKLDFASLLFQWGLWACTLGPIQHAPNSLFIIQV